MHASCSTALSSQSAQRARAQFRVLCRGCYGANESEYPLHEGKKALNKTQHTFKAGTEHRTNTIRELVRPVITPSSSL